MGTRKEELIASTCEDKIVSLRSHDEMMVKVNNSSPHSLSANCWPTCRQIVECLLASKLFGELFFTFTEILGSLSKDDGIHNDNARKKLSDWLNEEK